ncbi:hypothetical protein C8R47DRAFT_1137076 [Mycena vitilis]|nr:hypothetical protein C8R47DRAFT_1137076 [Mycena vitilis]
MTDPNPDPVLPAPFTSTTEEEAWEAAISTYITHIVIYKLSPETTPAALFAPFAAPQHPPLLFAHACAHLLRATRETSEAGAYIPLLGGLFGLLKDEGLRRDADNADAVGAWGNAVVFPTLRALASDIPAPPGYTYDSVEFVLVPDADYVQDDADLSAFADYARAHAGLLRFWVFVARLEADGLLGSPAGSGGTMSLLFHRPPILLRGLEDPVQRGVWETLWAAVGGSGDAEDLNLPDVADDELSEAARKIARDEKTPVQWRGRFAVSALSFFLSSALMCNPD